MSSGLSSDKSKSSSHAAFPDCGSIHAELFLASAAINSLIFLRFISTACFIVLCASSCNNPSTSPAVKGDEVHFQQNTVKSVAINVANLRKVGEHYFKRNGSMGNRAPIPLGC